MSYLLQFAIKSQFKIIQKIKLIFNQFNSNIFIIHSEIIILHLYILMKNILLLLSFVLIASSIDPPLWPNVWTQQFVINYTYAGGVYTVGKHWYDYNKNAQRVTYQNGQYEVVCGSVLPNTSTQCTQMIVDGNLYVIYPQKEQCCRCCSGAFGCTIKKPNWLSIFNYAGQQTLSGQRFYKWNYLKLDYYAKQNEQRIPRRINQEGYKIQDFIMNSYTEDPISDEVFQLPAYCNKDCSRSTICGQLEPGKGQNLQYQ